VPFYPTSGDAVIAKAYEHDAVVFCLAGRVVALPTEDGGLVVAHVDVTDDETILAAIESPSRWVLLGYVEVPEGGLVGLSASATLEQARAAGKLLEVPLAADRYEVRQVATEDDGSPGVGLLRLRRS
jgi:hypothetical protein